MTRDETGLCVQVPVSLAGLVIMWAIVVALLTWDSWLGGPQAASDWGLAISAAAAAWTVIYGIREQTAALRNAFELGRDHAEHANVRSLS